MEIKLPDVCPECGASFKDDEAAYHCLGIQYCHGIVNSLPALEESVEIDLEGAGDSWDVEPYHIYCSECGCILWEKTILVAENKDNLLSQK